MYYVSFLRVILFKGDADHRDLHSFPTRRSSDLSSRLRAASIAIWIFSLTRFCPMYSSSRRGRTLTSMRSEEHTSELQSRQYLVCRLLLEKKKRDIRTTTAKNPNRPLYQLRQN